MNSEKEKIAIIDTEFISLKLMESFIKGMGYDVRTAPDALNGIKLILSWKPDVVFIDTRQIALGNTNLFDKLKEIAPDSDTSFVLLFPDNKAISEKTIVNGYSYGASDYLSKPFKMWEVKFKLGNALRQRKYREILNNMNSQLGREKEILSQYFSKDIVDKIMSGDLTNQLGGESLESTIMFVDIRNFTTLSERLKPQQIASLLNQLFADMMDLIFRNQGSVNKLLGDAILATFGCPVNTDNDAGYAVQTAIEIQEFIKGFNEVRPDFLGDVEIKAGVGIATGHVFAGNIGYFRRMEYTVIGDVVNTSSRLQNMTKVLGKDILIDGRTFEKVKAFYDCEKMDVSAIRGKEQEIDIFSVKTAKDRISEDMPASEVLDSFVAS